MPEDILDRLNRLQAHLADYRPSKREKQIGRSAAYYERLNKGRLPMRKYKAGMNRGQVPMTIRNGELQEVEEFGTGLA